MCVGLWVSNPGQCIPSAQARYKDAEEGSGASTVGWQDQLSDTQDNLPGAQGAVRLTQGLRCLTSTVLHKVPLSFNKVFVMIWNFVIGNRNNCFVFYQFRAMTKYKKKYFYVHFPLLFSEQEELDVLGSGSWSCLQVNNTFLHNHIWHHKTKIYNHR